VTRVIVVPNRRDAMGYYRLMWPAYALQINGHDVQVAMGDEVDGTRSRSPIQWVPTADGKHVKDVNTPNCDVIVLQRCTQWLLVEIIEIWQSRGIKVVMDLDDDFRTIDPMANPAAHKLLHSGGEVSWQAADAACRTVDSMIVSTPALQRLYGGTLIRNHIPSWYLDVPHSVYRKLGMFGWSGAIKYRHTDPEVVGRSFARLQSDGFRMGMVGDGKGVQEAFHLPYPPLSTGFVLIEDYPLLVTSFHVGTVPLKDLAFNRAKSWLKGIEYAALGVPFVASPSPEYEYLHETHNVGVLARNDRQWYREVKNLLTDDDYAASVAWWGYEFARRHTIEGNCNLWWDAWTATLNAPRQSVNTTDEETRNARKEDKPGSGSEEDRDRRG